ncbi:MAG: hypothetical protein COV75_08615 [Candidatus Omnitrophica bacterium CG11_big_fil_rev_8_21_14_0_20_63_9]|nr:MAG: hypothetical protein COV75_08615 [Candidatus Omnitrophica bacterium CG11_big_fil_rev_8_21_14_0_20_63_9]
MRPSRGAWICAFLSLIGFALAAYLTYLHYGLLRGEFLGGAACGGGTFNCHAVTGGRWASWLGMPVSLWGAFGYLLALGLSLLARQSAQWAEAAFTLLAGLALAFMAVDLYLLYLMAAVIRNFCLFCLFTYAVNLGLLVAAASSIGRPWPQALGGFGAALGWLRPTAARPAAWLFWGIALSGLLATAGVHATSVFLTRGPAGAVRTQIRDYVARQSRVALDVAGDPTLGRADASIQIVEFSDFLCPACQQASKMNAILLANYRSDVTLVFKNYPLDSTCNSRVPQPVHPGACYLAAALECANLQGKFWPFHDLVFHDPKHYVPSRMEEDALRLGLDVARFRSCIDSGQGMAAVKQDIEQAAVANVNRTPTYVINGVPIAGGLTPATFDDLVAVLKETGGR